MNLRQASIATDHQQPNAALIRAQYCCLAMVMVLLSVASRAHAIEPLEYSIRARVDRSARIVEGAMWARVRVDAADTAINFWLYADRASMPPRSMDEVSSHWIYPGEISRGGIVVTQVRVDGVRAQSELVSSQDPERTIDAAGHDLRVSINAGGPREVIVQLRFAVTVPERYGRFGVVDDQMTLAAPWYPLVVDGDTFAFAAPHHVDVEVTGDDEALVGEVHGRGRIATSRAGEFVPAVIAKRLHITPLVEDGFTLRLISATRPFRQPPRDAPAETGVRDLTGVDRVEPLLSTWRDVRTTSRQLGVPTSAVMTVVQIPEWIDLAGVAPGWALLSEHAFEVTPFPIALGFHERAVRRALFRSLLDRSDNAEPAADRDAINDLRAVLLTDLDGVRRRDQRQRPDEVLKFASFHPAVDQILYAPQVPFEQAYFGTNDEIDRFRDAPDHARVPVASGRRLLEGMRDVMTPDELSSLAVLLLRDRVPFRVAVGRVRPDLVERIDQWLMWPRLRVNYRLGKMQSTRIASVQGANNRRRARYRHHIEVWRDGAQRREPVTVEIEDARGHRARGQWDGGGERGEVVIESAAPLVDVQIDPDHRVTQSPEITDGHPFADDTNALPLRPPLLKAWDLSYAPNQQAWATYFDVAVRPKFDLDHTFGFGFAANVRATGGYIEYEQGLGRKVHTNRRIGAVAAGLELRRLHDNFGEDPIGGYRFGLITRASLSSIKFMPDPRHGFYVNAYARLNAVRRDRGGWTQALAGGVRAGAYLPVGLRNVSLLILGADGLAGQGLQTELPDLADGLTMRGFVFGELLGRARLYSMFEHRLTALSNLAWNALHLSWVRQLQLAVFAAGGLVIDAVEGPDVQAHAEVGAGVRFQMHMGGIQPSLLRVDVARPLTRAHSNGRPPLGVIVGFEQPY